MLNLNKEIIVTKKSTGEKMFLLNLFLLNLTAIEYDDYYMAIDKNGIFFMGHVSDIKVVLSDEQKAMLS